MLIWHVAIRKIVPEKNTENVLLLVWLEGESGNYAQLGESKRS